MSGYTPGKLEIRPSRDGSGDDRGGGVMGEPQSAFPGGNFVYAEIHAAKIAAASSVAYWTTSVTDAQIIRAHQVAEIHKSFLSLAEALGYETPALSKAVES